MMKMQIGQIIDYCIEYENMQAEAEKEQKSGRRKATPEEVAAFFG